MSFLSAFLAAVGQRLLGQVFVTQLLANPFSAGGYRITAQVGGIGTHIGDMAGLIKALGHHHRLLHPETEAGAGCLLQGGGNKGCGRLRPGGSLLALADGEGAGLLQRLAVLLRVVTIVRAKVHALVFGHFQTQGFTLLAVGIAVHFPEFFRDEGTDFPLTLHHQFHGDGLHPAGGQATGNLFPQ